jgi:hypothetical protein
MKKQAILKSFLSAVLLLSISSQGYASEVTGSLSSSGVTSQQGSGGNDTSGSVATGTLASSVVGTGSGQITGTVTGGSSGGGSSSSGGGGGGTGGGMVLGASTASNNPSTNGAVLGASNISNNPGDTTFSYDGLALMPRTSSLAFVSDEEDPSSLAVGDDSLLGDISPVVLGEEAGGFWSVVWFWSILLLLLLLAAAIYRYIRNSQEHGNRTK